MTDWSTFNEARESPHSIADSRGAIRGVAPFLVWIAAWTALVAVLVQ